jgi:hypothetical protein
MGYNDRVEIKSFLGLVFTEISKTDDEIIFTTNTGDKYKMFHQQDCCESVSIDDINGDLNDLLNTPITMASETSNSDPSSKMIEEKKVAEEKGEYYWGEESFTWTFYKLATIKGFVDIKWFGTSNGYYSESVDIEKL